MPLGSKSRFHTGTAPGSAKACGSLMGASSTLVQFRRNKVPERKTLHMALLATLDLTPPARELAGNGEEGAFKTGRDPHNSRPGCLSPL